MYSLSLSIIKYKMKLIKISDDHYVVVDDEPIEEGDYCTTHLNVIDVGKIHNSYTIFNPQNKEHLDMVKCCKKITHSTQPLEVKITDEGIHLPDWSKIKALSPRVVKELIGEVDVEKRVSSFFPSDCRDLSVYKFGLDMYNQCLEDNKDKKYTEEDMKYMFECGRNYQNNAEVTFKMSMGYLQQPKTEWEIEEIDGKFKLK